MSFFNLLFNFGILFFNVSWFNTTIELPLGSDIYDYIDSVEANIYEDGQLISDAKVSYQFNGVNRTFITTINTNYVGTYTLFVEAYFEYQDVKDIAKLEINVVDVIPPVITYIPTYTIAFGQDMPDLLDNIDYEDNYDANDKLLIDVDASLVNEARIGNYEIFYHIIDSSNNESVYTKIFSIVDRISPEIILKKQMIIDVHEPLIIEDFIEVKDNYDLNVRLKIIDSNINYDQLGLYEIIVIATDISNNTTKETFLVSVVDQKPPDLVLSSNPQPITVYSKITDTLLKSYILSISDNHDVILLDDLNITHDIDSKRLGKYHIYYTCSDLSHNVTTKSLEVAVIDDVKPFIENTSPLIFNVFDQNPIFSEYFHISDNYNAFDDLTIKYAGAFNLEKIGRYQLLVEATDQSKNKAVYVTEIVVMDQTAPEITQISEIIITNFEPLDLSIYFNAFDQYDLEENYMIIDDQFVDYSKIGSYDISVYATDLSDNTAIFLTKIHLIDITAPVISLSTDTIYLNLGEERYTPLSYILEVSDNYDEILIDDVSIISTVDIFNVGKYQLIYTLIDSSLNDIQKIINVYVDDYEAPIIKGDSLYISMYESIDLLEGLDIEDNVGIYQVYYEPRYIDASYPGSYEISYRVSDLRGNITTFTRMIYIESIEQSYKIIDFIPIIILMISSISCLYYLYKKL